ncbi:MAG: plasmid stabilization protein ParE [Acidobacteriaceae bacterium]|nr:plasmid stabilization protein ParE [Acidobacteriaceae bacterium]
MRHNLSEVIFSRSSELDLQKIDEYTESTWGTAQADLYLDQIHAFCKQLAANPNIGRVWTKLRPGLFRMQHRRHIIFYRETPQGIFVSRILHQSMLPERQPFE